MLKFVIKLVETTREITLANLNKKETISLGKVKELSTRNATINCGDKQPLLSDQKTSVEVVSEHFTDESLELLDKLQKAFPEYVSWRLEDNLLEFKILVSESSGFDLEYVDKEEK